jgi:hypothetical protein
MTINFADENGGTFSSFFDLFFDIRLNAVDGGIIFSADKRFETAGTEWDRLPETGDILIDGINHFLLGLNDPAGDFFPEPLTEFIPSNEEGTVHKASAATIPEPGALWMLMVGLLGLGAAHRRQAPPPFWVPKSRAHASRANAPRSGPSLLSKMFFVNLDIRR